MDKEYHPYFDYTTPPTKDGKYSVIVRVGSMSTELKERFVLFKVKNQRWMLGDWQAPIVWRELYEVEKEKIEGKE